MKTLSILFLTLFISIFKIAAQSSLIVTDLSSGQVAIQNNGIIFLTTTGGNAEITSINIKNTSAFTKYYKLKRYDDVLNTGADAMFEAGGIGYAPTTTLTPIAVTLTANGTLNDNLFDQNTLHKLYLYEAATTGISHIRYEIFDENNLSDSFTFSIYYNDVAASLKDNSQVFEGISDIYPNPAINKVSINIISNETTNNGVISISNNLGATITTKHINLTAGANTIDLNTESLSSGIYFANISSSKNKISKKFIVNK